MTMARFHYDTAFALSQGGRDYQEDCLLSVFGGGAAQGFAVLADGMGGQAAGDVASQLVAYEVAFDLHNRLRNGPGAENALPDSLRNMADRANDTIADNVEQYPDRDGMGATLLATVMFQNRLYWVSVGDSPLYLFRDGVLRQINEDHSMAPIIAKMVEDGELDAEAAANHPSRNALTSVLMGEKIKLKNVPQTPTELRPGDIVIAASDGLQFLSNDMIRDTVAAQTGASSQQICIALMQALEALGDPDQDNVAILVLQLGGGGDMAVRRERPQAITRERPVAAAPSTAETYMPEPQLSATPVPQPKPVPRQAQRPAPKPTMAGHATMPDLASTGAAKRSVSPLLLMAAVLIAALVLAYLVFFGRPAPARMQMSALPVLAPAALTDDPDTQNRSLSRD